MPLGWFTAAESLISEKYIILTVEAGAALESVKAEDTLEGIGVGWRLAARDPTDRSQAKTQVELAEALVEEKQIAECLLQLVAPLLASLRDSIGSSRPIEISKDICELVRTVPHCLSTKILFHSNSMKNLLDAQISGEVRGASQESRLLAIDLLTDGNADDTREGN